jgi:hypothetical protein
MDMKKLIAQIDHIESKQILNEGFPTVAEGAEIMYAEELAEKVFDQSPNLQNEDDILTRGFQLAKKDPRISGRVNSIFRTEDFPSDFVSYYRYIQHNHGISSGTNEDVEFQGSIAQMLLREFGLDERVTINPDGTTSGGIAKPPAAAPAAGAAPAVKNPYQGADAAKFAAMSPQDQAWLTKGGGVPDINDEFILARAPNKGKASGGAAQPAAPAQVPAGINPETGEKYDDGTNAPLQEPPGAEKPAGGGDTGEVPGVTTQSGATPTVPAGINPETGEKYDDGTNAPLQEPPGAEKPAGGAAQPAAPAANKSMTPAITAYAASMGLLKGGKPDVAAIKKFQQDNGLKADGIIGPNTAGAILSAQKPGMAGSGRGGQGGPTAAQLAQAPKPAGGGAQPATGSVKPRYKTPQEFDKEIARFSKTSNPNLPPNARYIATLQAEKAALSGGAAQPARPALPGKAVPGGGQISDTPAAESMLQRIKSLAGL